MKISNKDCVQFETIGTILAFQERPFYPDTEIYNLSEAEIEHLLEVSELDTEGIGSINFPSNQVSDLSETALYDFCFNLVGDKKYIPNFYPGLLDDYSQEVLEDKFDIFSSYMVPQVSPSTFHHGPNYFGGFQDKEGNIIKLIKIPAGIWKLEIYNESRITWNTYYSDQYRIIDSDLIQAMNNFSIGNINLLYTPCLKVYFGPTYDTRLEDQSYRNALSNDIYASRYLKDDIILEKAYSGYPNIMSELDYVASYKGEVMAEKILYLSYTSNGEINEIKLIETSFNHHKNPNRNQNKLSMRMDDYLAHDFNPVEDHGKIALDKSNGLILGTRESTYINSDNEEVSGVIFFDQLKESSLPSLRSTRTKNIIVDGKEYINGNQEKLYQNPIISPDWYIKQDITSDYKKCRISCENGGTIFRKIGNSEEPIGGTKYFREGTQLILKPVESPGYRLSEVRPEADLIEDGYYTYNIIPETVIFKFNHETYIFRVHIICNKDYFNSNGARVDFDTNSYENSFVNERGIRLYIGDSISGFFEYDEEIVLDENSEISFILDTGEYYVPVAFAKGEILKASLRDLKIAGKYADYDIEVEVIKPEISLFGDVNFGKTRHFTIEFNGEITIEFYSEDPLWDDVQEALSHIIIQRGSSDPENPTADSYNPGEGDGFRSLTVSQIKTSNVKINIWTEI